MRLENNVFINIAAEYDKTLWRNWYDHDVIAKYLKQNTYESNFGFFRSAFLPICVFI